MEKTGYIEIYINGSKGNVDLSPDNYDIREIVSILENAENLLFPDGKSNRPTISYRIEDGSVKHILKTSMQAIIGFNAIIGQIVNLQNIDFLELNSAKAFENLQETAIKRNYSFDIKTSIEHTNVIKIDRTTNYFRTESIWADADFYFYGKVTNAGVKEKANIHIITDEVGIVRIETPKSFLEKYEENILYRTFGIHAIGKQHSVTGEIDTTTLKFVELIDYQPKYDEKYLKTLREKAKKAWLANINPDEWLKVIRGSYEA